MTKHDLSYLELLSEQFPTRRAAYTEIINLQAILNLPCGTEHFISDIHGELEAFTHILNNCSGVIRERVNALYADELDERTRADLCTLVYYPDEKLELMRRKGELSPERLYDVLVHLTNLARRLADGYTRSHVRKMLPPDYDYIIDELLHISLGKDSAHHTYHEDIVHSVVEIGAAEDFIRSIAHLIKRLAVDRIHVVGDIYDRGPTSSGATTTWRGWAPQRVARCAWRRWCAPACTTTRLRCWKARTASPCASWRSLPTPPTPTSRAPTGCIASRRPST